MVSSVLRARRAMAWVVAVGVSALAVGCGTVHASGAQSTVTVTVSATRPGTSPAGTPSPAAAPGGPCGTAALRMTLGPASAATGHFYRPVVFTNISGASCTLYGYPGISFVAAIGGKQIGAAAGRSPASKQLVVLAPGGKAHALLDLLDVLNFPAPVCAARSAHWLKIYPPSQFSAGYVRWTAEVCSKSKPVYVFVAPVRQGA
jgi:Protein of unknown function (DUF4232)